MYDTNIQNYGPSLEQYAQVDALVTLVNGDFTTVFSADDKVRATALWVYSERGYHLLQTDGEWLIFYRLR